MKYSFNELRAIINQMYKEQVVPEYADRQLVMEYEYYMKHISMMERDSSSCNEEADTFLIEDAQRSIDKNYSVRLNPATAKVGEGATVHLYSDSHAYTIIGKSKTGYKLTLRRCKATLSKDFHPEFVAGGFAGHCTNQNAQSYTYEEDEDGEIITAFWSRSDKSYNHNGLYVSKGRNEFYDYNF